MSLNDNPLLKRPDVTLAVSRGVVRALLDRGYIPLMELTVASGRRIDVAGLGPNGEIIAVEVKSSIEDYRADQKWPEYFEWCDKLYFA
ncbi:MAG TPA: DNA repair protein MmcB-related protein, partial [Alphaproteobacteria bacterium]|nr:DNA repair protein MmcB-related protein [Alphaproteobacteria bacterium]